MQAILDICCGLDVHKDSVVACIIKSKKQSVLSNQTDDVDKEIRVFKTFLDDLTKLRDWLESENCHHVAMESTGVYWHPIYDALEPAFNGNIELLVVNARHMKNVPSKKTDFKDAEWIALLLRAGLLRGSFIPPQDIRELRQLTRYRKHMTNDINTQKNRIEKSLQQAGFKFSTFLSDIFCLSGRNLMNVLILKGKLTPLDVEEQAKFIRQVKRDEIKTALNGKLSKFQRDFLQLQLSHLDEITKHLVDIEKSIAKITEPFAEEIALMDTIPGIAKTSAIAILAEIGGDMRKFPTAEHFCSWAGLAPGSNTSANKKKKVRA